MYSGKYAFFQLVGIRYRLSDLLKLILICSLVFFTIGTLLLPKLRTEAKYRAAVSRIQKAGISFNYDWFERSGLLHANSLIADQLSKFQVDIQTLAPNTQQVSLTNSVLSKHDFVVLSNMSNVYDLDLRGSLLPDEFAQMVAKIPGVARIDLANSRWPNDQIADLSKCAN